MWFGGGEDVEFGGLWSEGKVVLVGGEGVGFVGLEIVGLVGVW